MTFTPQTLTLPLLALLVLAGCGNKQDQSVEVSRAAVAASAESPTAAVASNIRNLRENNFKALVEASVPPQYLPQIRAEWQAKLDAKPITDADRAEFEADMERLTAPDAEQKLWAELEPQMDKFRKEAAMQMPMMVGIGRGILVSALQQSEDLSEDQKQQAVKGVDAFAHWMETAPFTDAALAQKSIGVLCNTARALKLESLDQVRAMDFDQMLEKAGVAAAGLKQIFDIYGFSVDRALDSARTELVSNEGNQARVKVGYSLFDSTLDFESELELFEGRWYDRNSLNKMREKAASGDQAAAPVETDQD